MRIDGLDHHARRLKLDRIAERLEGDCRADLLRERHGLDLTALMLLLGLLGAEDERSRHQRGSLVDAGNEVLEEAGLLDLDGDVVDAAAILVGPLALDLDEGRKRPGAVWQEDVLVGRDEIEERRHGRRGRGPR